MPGGLERAMGTFDWMLMVSLALCWMLLGGTMVSAIGGNPSVPYIVAIIVGACVLLFSNFLFARLLIEKREGRDDE